VGGSDRAWCIEQAGLLGWDFVPSKKGYDKLRCPCGVHQTWLHRTPSNPNYFRERIAYLRRTCPPPEGGD
jgi:hypothetical protein